MLEISVIKNIELIYSYDSLTKKQQKKLYNITVLGLAMLDLEQLKLGYVSLSGWSFFGINPSWLLLSIAIIAGVSFLASIVKEGTISVDIILKNLLWLLVALIPGIVGILFMISNFHIYI